MLNDSRYMNTFVGALVVRETSDVRYNELGGGAVVGRRAPVGSLCKPFL